MRTILMGIVLICSLQLWAQDPGRPLPREYWAYIHNNTPNNIRYSVTSWRGVSTGTVAPGRYGRFPFLNDGSVRGLVVADMRTKELLSAREVTLSPNFFYEAQLIAMMFQGGGAAPAPAPMANPCRKVCPPARSASKPRVRKMIGMSLAP